MIPPDDMAIQLAAARDQILGVMLRHEVEVHHGAPCMSNRASVIGYLMHCLGCRDLVLIESLLEEWDLNCPGCPLHPRGGAKPTPN